MSTICDLIETLNKTNARFERIQASLDEALLYYNQSQTFTSAAMGIWVSSTDPSQIWNDSYIANNPTGYVDELQRTGQAAPTVGTEVHQVQPYTTELLPVADLSPVYDAARVMIKSATFLSIDTTRLGGLGQDPSTYAALVGTIGTDRALMQSMYQNGQIAHWQPNWFRPMIRLDSQDILYGNLRNSESPKGHQGHLSIGLPLPWGVDNLDLHLGSIKGKTLRVYAQVAQYIAATARWQRSCILAYVDFRLGSR